jgi:hypothetical protein
MLALVAVIIILMGNFIQTAWLMVLGSGLSYAGLFLYRDYKKKNIKAIKNLKPNQTVSIEGEVRLMDRSQGKYESVYKKEISYILEELPHARSIKRVDKGVLDDANVREISKCKKLSDLIKGHRVTGTLA